MNRDKRVNIFIHIDCRDNCRNLLELIVHGLENVSLPSVWRDWDMDKGGIEDHKRRRTRVLLEMISIMVVRSAFHAIMVLPVIFTGIWKSNDKGKIYIRFYNQLKMFGEDMIFLKEQLGSYQKNNYHITI